MDFPSLLRQAGSQHVGLLCVPANDNRTITPYHARITAFRAIEQGLTVVRATGNGLSVAYGSTGRELGALTCFDNAEGRLLTDVPLQHRQTLYTAIGDAAVWACTVGLVLLLAIAFLETRQSRRANVIGAGQFLTRDKG
jgi:apolipoprotein N-acyltransferase